MLNGDFSAVPFKLNAPFATINGKPNQINPNQFSPAAVLIDKTALPLGQAPATGQLNFVGSPTVNNYHENTDRLDYNLSNNQRLTLRSFIDYFTQHQSTTKGNILSYVLGEHMEYYNELLSHTWTINPSTVNVFAGFWTQMSAHNGTTLYDSSGQPFCMSRYINVNELPGSCYLDGFSASNGFGIFKNWQIRERYGIQFRWEAFNALNHPSFGTPNTNPTASNFGQITWIGAIPPRVMQGTLKLTF